MPYSFILTTIIPASAQEIYDAWLDSLTHSEMTGGAATMSGEVGAEISAWDGYITGRNLELVPGERIVQSWRTTEFEDEHEDSVITITLEDVEDGTLLTLEHSNVPDEQRSYEEGGWQSNYFEPMAAYFAEEEDIEESEEEPAAEAPQAPRPRGAPRRKATAAPKKPRAAKKAAAGGARRKAKSAAKSAAKRAGKKAAKRAPKRGKSKRTALRAAAAAKRPRAKKAARKSSVRGKRK